MSKALNRRRLAAAAVGMAALAASAAGSPIYDWERDAAVHDGYEAGLRNDNEVRAWQNARPGLVIDGRINGASVDAVRTMAERAGVTQEDHSSERTKAIFEEVENVLKYLGRQRDLSGSASTLVVAKAFFRPKDPLNESICTVTITSGIHKIHNHLKDRTGWPGDVIRDFVLRHERSHCIEQSDHNALLMHQVTGRVELAENRLFANAQPFVSDESRERIATVVKTMKRNKDYDHPEDRMRMDAMTAAMASRVKETVVMSEQMCDAIAVLTLINEGRLKIADIETVARVRDEDSGNDHHTADFLRDVQRRLVEQPDVVKGWRSGHQKDLKEGRGLQISDQLAWLQPVWIGHVNGLKKAKADARSTSQQGLNERFEKAEERVRQQSSGKNVVPIWDN